jgi:hypothetical protein
MSSVVRTVLGVALLLTGASAAMAASNNPPAGNQTVQAGASNTVAASNNAPVANQTVQTGASAAVVAPANAPAADKPRKAPPSVPDNNAPFAGNDPNSSAGMRAFFSPQY